jgi:hypothetical protein
MARTPGRDVPRYIFHVQRQSELVGRLRELERGYRLAGTGRRCGRMPGASAA